MCSITNLQLPPLQSLCMMMFIAHNQLYLKIWFIKTYIKCFTIQFFLTEGEFEGVHTGEDGVSPSRSWHWGSTPDCVGLSKAISPTASVTWGKKKEEKKVKKWQGPHFEVPVIQSILSSQMIISVASSTSGHYSVVFASCRRATLYICFLLIILYIINRQINRLYI